MSLLYSDYFQDKQNIPIPAFPRGASLALDSAFKMGLRKQRQSRHSICH